MLKKLLKNIFLFFSFKSTEKRIEENPLSGIEFCKVHGHFWTPIKEENPISFPDLIEPLRISYRECYNCEKIQWYNKRKSKEYIKIFDNPWKRE